MKLEFQMVTKVQFRFSFFTEKSQVVLKGQLREVVILLLCGEYYHPARMSAKLSHIPIDPPRIPVLHKTVYHPKLVFITENAS